MNSLNCNEANSPVENELNSSSEFVFSNLIDYKPDGKKIKFDDESLPENLLQSPRGSPAPIESTDYQQQSINFEMMLQRIKEFQKKLNMDEFKGKSAEMLVCSICYEIHRTIDLLRDHYITVHDYAAIESESKEDDISIKIEVNVATTSNENVATAKKDDSVKIIPENDASLDPAWQKPITLKMLKKKLYEIFSKKCTFNGCVYQFENDEKQKLHEKCHVSSDAEQIRQFKCLKCSNESKSWRDCTSHMWKEHKVDIDLLKCPFCSFRAVFSVKIYRHLQVHRNLKGFQCSSCPSSFEQFIQLRQHAVSTHMDKNGQSRWYSKKTCDICSNEFATSKTLSKHIKAVHNRIKPFICNVCGYKSARKSTWEIHVRQHTGEKPMNCKFCKFCTADPSVLRKHEMRHNDKSKYQCTKCEYSCIQSINFKNHTKRYHPDYYQTLLCDQCSFVSVNLDALRKHLQDHKLGLIRNDDSNDGRQGANSTLVGAQSKRNVEISSDSFLPVESTDSLAHDVTVDTGGVTIPAQHSDEAQFPNF